MHRLQPIPASAGEPVYFSPYPSLAGAYPRQRWGTSCAIKPIWVLSGPIPASAGEPTQGSRCPQRTRAYPRQRGGTIVICSTPTISPGLSPPARGNHRECVGRTVRCGPIPASAGEPWATSGGGCLPRAYPRQRGGTRLFPDCGLAVGGLSPPARGNLGRAGEQPIMSGPIPASAGEPAVRIRRRPVAGAYPRQRGGTFPIARRKSRRKGLSPPARGNRHDPLQAALQRGPIPASAGEPCQRAWN